MSTSPFEVGVAAARTVLQTYVRCDATRSSGSSRVLTDHAHAILCTDQLPHRVRRTSLETRVALLGLLPYVATPLPQRLLVVAPRDDPCIDACVHDILAESECSVLSRAAAGKIATHPSLRVSASHDVYSDASVIIVKDLASNAAAKLADAVCHLDDACVLVVLYGLCATDADTWLTTYRDTLPQAWLVVVLEADT